MLLGLCVLPQGSLNGEFENPDLTSALMVSDVGVWSGVGCTVCFYRRIRWLPRVGPGEADSRGKGGLSRSQALQACLRSPPSSPCGQTGPPLSVDSGASAGIGVGGSSGDQAMNTQPGLPRPTPESGKPGKLRDILGLGSSSLGVGWW